jgi:hypothetical protein
MGMRGKRVSAPPLDRGAEFPRTGPEFSKSVPFSIAATGGDVLVPKTAVSRPKEARSGEKWLFSRRLGFMLSPLLD